MSGIELKKLRILDRQVHVKEQELEHVVSEAHKNTWKSPLVVAIFAAAVGALGNALITYYSSYLDREAAATEYERSIALAESDAERERILEMIKIGEPEQVQRNLEFLVDTELVQDPETVASIRSYYENRAPGTGPGTSGLRPGSSRFASLSRTILSLAKDYTDPSLANALEELVSDMGLQERDTAIALFLDCIYDVPPKSGDFFSREALQPCIDLTRNRLEAR